MSQPIKKQKKLVARKVKTKTSRTKSGKKNHPQYGTSKLETIFETTILKKLGVAYERQFYAPDIKRYYDFVLVGMNVLIEIDGDYW